MLTVAARSASIEPMGKARVLVVEDDDTLRDLLRLTLCDDGFEVRVASTGDEALSACEAERPDVVVLDVMLPGRSGIEVCALLRRLHEPSPGVVMVSARGAELDVVLGLEVGADDYVVKPCRPREVSARVKALLRRLSPRGADASQVLTRGALVIDCEGRRVRCREAALTLTATEFSLLAFLARHPGRVYSRAQLLDAVFDTDVDAYGRNVDSHVARLRKKIEQAGVVPAPIRTVHGVGYSFDEAR